MIEAGYVDSALVDFTNGVGGREDMRRLQQQIDNGSLFKQLLQWKQQGFLLGAGSPAGTDDVAHMPNTGIVQGHAYSLLDVREVDGQQFVRVRNPWGHTEWNGDFSDKSPKWTARLKQKLDFLDQDDGMFWMTFKDFTMNFHSYYVCRIFPEAEGWAKPIDIKGEWKGTTAGGCTNTECVRDNPQYHIDVSAEMDIVIQLSQPDTRGNPNHKKFFAISCEIYYNDGDRVARTKTGILVARNPDSYAPRRDVCLEMTMKPAPGGIPYSLLVSTFAKGEESPFVITVFYKPRKKGDTLTIKPIPA
jgi:hypothetical protein